MLDVEARLLLSAKDEQIRALREVAKQLARTQRVETWALNILRHVYRAWADFTLVRAVQRDEASARRTDDERWPRAASGAHGEAQGRETDDVATARAHFMATLPLPGSDRAPRAGASGALTDRARGEPEAPRAPARDFAAEAQIPHHGDAQLVQGAAPVAHLAAYGI